MARYFREHPPDDLPPWPYGQGENESHDSFSYLSQSRPTSMYSNFTLSSDDFSTPPSLSGTRQRGFNSSSSLPFVNENAGSSSSSLRSFASPPPLSPTPHDLSSKTQSTHPLASPPLSLRHSSPALLSRDRRPIPPESSNKSRSARDPKGKKRENLEDELRAALAPATDIIRSKADHKHAKDLEEIQLKRSKYEYLKVKEERENLRLVHEHQQRMAELEIRRLMMMQGQPPPSSYSDGSHFANL